MRPPSRRATAALVAACCVLTLAAKLAVNAPRDAVNHGDVSFYVTVAKNLAEGRGFLIDYIWNFWNHPAGIPAPSNDWWMPLPSLICAVGMRIGGIDYGSAQLAMIALTSLLPWIVYLLGRDMFGSVRLGLIGALLSTSFHLFLDQPCAPLSHGPYMMLCSLTLWLITRSADDRRYLFFVGASLALTQLCRSDGLMLVGALLAARRADRRGLLAVALGYGLLMAPWWAHNLAAYGAPMPGGSFRALFMKQYAQWYSLPESVTPQTWLQEGWAPVLRAKAATSLENLLAFSTGMSTGGVDRQPRDLALLATLAFSWIGLAGTLRRRFAPMWTLIALEWTFYSLLFTAVGSESFRSSMFSVYPCLVLCAAKGLTAVMDRIFRRLNGMGAGATALVVAWLLWAHFSHARQSMAVKVEGIERLGAFHAALASEVFPALGLSDTVIMARDVHELHAITGVRCVQIPFEDEATIRAVARRYGATHLLRVGERPALGELQGNPHFEQILPATLVCGQIVQIHRFVD